MLDRLCRWSKQRWQGLFAAPIAPPDLPATVEVADLSYENCLMAVLEEVAQGQGWGVVQAILITHQLKPAQLAQWMEQWSEEKIEQLADSHELVRRLTLLGQLGRGELGSAARTLLVRMQSTVGGAEASTKPDNVREEGIETFPEGTEDSAEALFYKGVESFDAKDYLAALHYFEQSIRLDPTHPLPWNGKGNVFLVLQQYEEALAAFDEAIRLDPTNAALWNDKGIVLRNLQQYEEALEAYEEAIRLDPTFALPWNNKGIVLRNLQQYEEALEAYEEAIELDPSYASPYHGKGNVLEELKQYEGALEAYEEAIRLNPTSADYRNSKGSVLLHFQEYEGALAAYEETIRLNPTFSLPWYGKGSVLLHFQEYEGALAAYEEAIRLNPTFSLPWYGKGSVLLHLQEYEGALAAYEEAIRLNPTSADYRNSKGYVLEKLKQYEKALVAYEEAIQLDSTSAFSWNRKGKVLLHLQKYEGALAAYEEAIRLNPTSADYRNSKGYVLEKLKQYEKALVAYEEAIQLDPAFLAAWHHKGIVLDELHQYEAALTTFEEAIRLDPTVNFYWNSKGIVLHHLKQYEKALAAFEEAVRLDPTVANCWHCKGTVLDELHQYEAALTTFEEAIRLDPTVNLYWNSKGIVLQHLKQYEKALAAFEKAIQLNPAHARSWFYKGVLLNVLHQHQEALAVLDHALHLSQGQLWEIWEHRGWTLFDYRGYQQAIDNWDQGLATYQSTHLDADYVYRKLHQLKGEAYYRQGRQNQAPPLEQHSLWRKSIASFKAALHQLELTQYPELSLEVLRDLVRVLLDLGGQENRAQAQELARQKTELKRWIEQHPDLSPAYKRQLMLKGAGIDQLTVDLAMQTGDVLEALKLAEEGKNTCLSWLLKDEPPYPEENLQPSIVERLSQLLDDSTAALYWHLSPAALSTFLILPDGTVEPLSHSTAAPTHQNALSPAYERLQRLKDWMNQWDEHYANYRGKGKGKASGKQKEQRQSHPWFVEMPNELQKLGDILGQPAILACLKQHPSITQLVLFPHQELHRFPIHACFPTYPCTYLPSVQIGLSLNPSPRPLHHLLLVENPSSALDIEGVVYALPELPYANVEAALIALRFPRFDPTHHCLDGTHKLATHAQVCQELEQPFDVFHFCGHAMHEPRNPARSALFLEDKDTLDAFAIAELDLQHYRLVSLAACETAIARSATVTDEYVGLVSAFLYARAACVVSTLWTVESAASMLLMVEFYHQLHQGHSPTKALHAAQTWLKDATPHQLEQWVEQEIARLKKHQPDDPNSLIPSLEDLRDSFSRPSGMMEALSDNHELPPPYQHPYFWSPFSAFGR